MLAIAAVAPVTAPSTVTFPVTVRWTSRAGAWKSTPDGAYKVRSNNDASVVYENEDGTFSYGHVIEGVGNVPGPVGSRFTKKGYAALMADIDFADLDVPTMMARCSG